MILLRSKLIWGMWSSIPVPVSPRPHNSHDRIIPRRLPFFVGLTLVATMATTLVRRISSVGPGLFQNNVTHVPRGSSLRYMASVQMGHSTSQSSARLHLLPPEYLRQAASNNFDPITQQRANFPCDPRTGKPQTNHSQWFRIVGLDETSQEYQIKWCDGMVSVYSKAWIENQVDRYVARKKGTHGIQPKPWHSLTEDSVRQSEELSQEFVSVVKEPTSALTALYQYGILLVTGTPIHHEDGGESAIAALAAALGGGSVKNSGDDASSSLLSCYHPDDPSHRHIVLPHGTDGPLRTLYGTVWSTRADTQAAGASTADSAYSNAALPLHTDMTYYAHPPGLQIFTMVQPANEGGESVFADGLYCAEQLRTEHPEAFRTLSTVQRRYRCVDSATGWHLEATGPVIQLEGSNRIVAIRHNDLDRLPDVPPAEEEEEEDDTSATKHYERLAHAHNAWDSILARDGSRLIVALQPGDTMIVANQRCFHGRYSFTTSSSPRTVMGCYVSQDELDSRFRMLGLDVASK